MKIYFLTKNIDKPVSQVPRSVLGLSKTSLLRLSKGFLGSL